MLTDMRAAVACTGLALSLMAGEAIGPSPAVAQQLPEPRIIVIDVNYLLSEAQAMQGVQTTLQERQRTLESEMQAREEALREQDQALSRQRSVLSEEVFSQRRRELEQQFSDYQREYGEEIEQLDESYAAVVNQVRLELVMIADELASEYGANLVVPKSTLLLVHEGFDKTDEAFERLNERLPSVSLP